MRRLQVHPAKGFLEKIVFTISVARTWFLGFKSKLEISFPDGLLHFVSKMSEQSSLMLNNSVNHFSILKFEHIELRHNVVKFIYGQIQMSIK